MAMEGSRRPGRASKVKPTTRTRETPEVRRELLVRATMRSIAKFGYAGTTIETICGEAQVSRGLINHHFGSKDELILQSYKALRDEWMLQTHGSVMGHYPEPEDRLRAMIRVSFGPTMFKPEYLGIWAGFWSAIGKSPALRKLNRELFNKDREAYQRIFEDIAGKRGKTVDTRRAALTVIALIDGFWLEWCLDPKCFTAEEAEAACLAFVAQTFA
jgi:TetR/AcrR family transcriptional repressor of bet genes